MGLFVALSFGSVYPIAKPALAIVDPLLFSSSRYLLAGVLMLAALAITGSQWRVERRDIAKLTLLGIVGYTVFQAGWSYGLNITTPAKAVVLIATTPIFGALLGRILGEKLSLFGWLGILLAFSGVFVVINNSFSELNLAGSTILGDALYVGIAAIWALYGALSRATLLRLGTLRTTGWSAVIGSLLLAPLALPGALAQDWTAVDTATLAAFLYCAIMVGCFGLCAWGGGLARLGLTRISAYLYLSPICGVVLSGLVLGHWLSQVQLIGAGAVLLGVALTQTLGKPAAQS
jgi:drug/metabolite transporter (DMT)-like permease